MLIRFQGLNSLLNFGKIVVVEEDIVSSSHYFVDEFLIHIAAEPNMLL